MRGEIPVYIGAAGAVASSAALVAQLCHGPMNGLDGKLTLIL
jgi:hypothetical protein